MTEKDYLPQYTAELVHDLDLMKGYFKASAQKLLKIFGEEHPEYKKERNYYVTFGQMSDIIRESVHIVLPLNGQIYTPSSANKYSPEECASSQALPHRLTTFEYPVNANYYDAEYLEGLEIPDAEVVLAIDFKQMGEPTDFINPKLPDRYPLALMGFARFKRNNVSDINPDIRWVLNDHYITIYTPLVFTGASTEIGVSNIFTKESLYDDQDRITPELIDTGEKAVRTMTAPMETVVRACHALRVGAVLEERVEKSYTRTRTLQKQGVGGFEYHVLRLPHGTVKETLGSRAGGERDCPRYHFRRAHLRNLSSGAQTFVRSCFVGNRDKGVVEKNYEVTKEVAA